MNWDDVRFFLAVARGGSIRRAASLLGVNHGTVSRRIRQLESYHGRQLFEPSPSGFTLTSTGEDVYELASEIELDMAALSQRMSGRDVEIRGTVRISIGDNFTAQLAPIFARLRSTYPALQLQISVANHLANLANREVDIAVRVGNDPPHPMVGHRIGSMAMALYASRRYLAQKRSTSDIRDFDWIGWDESWSNAHSIWMEKTIPAAKVACRVDSPVAMYEMTRAGAGVAHLLCYLGDHDHDLVRVIPERSEFKAALWLVTHPEIRSTLRVRSAFEFLEQHLGKQLDLIEGRSPGPGRSRNLPDPHLPVR